MTPPGDHDPALQAELQCPDCAGQCLYDPSHQGLHCTSCGNTRGLDHADDDQAAEEFDYDPDAPQDEPPARTEAQDHSCRTCGGSVAFIGAALSERCPYCDGPVVLAAPKQGFATMALVPFRIPQEDARRHALTWVRGRIAAPAGLAAHVADSAHAAGLYAPFWTFDSSEVVQYWAKYTTGAGKNRRTHSTSGKMRIAFDDLLMPASAHVTPLIRDGILHDFDPRRLKPYRAGYLAGFAAERHHQSVAQGLRANSDDKDLLIRNRIRGHVDRRRVHGIRYRTDTSGIQYRRILLPVWIFHYRHGGKPYKVVVSGLDGRSFGERPFSAWKLAAYSGLISALTIGFGLAWGAAGLL